MKSQSEPNIDHFRNTFTTARQVLTAMREALVKSGLPQSKSAYHRMGEILHAQVATANSTELLRSELAEIARLAQEVHQILEPYSEIMLRIMSIAPVNEDQSASAYLLSDRMVESNQPVDSIYDWLKKQGGDWSLTALSTALSVPSSTLAPLLGALESKGRIKRRVAGGRPLYAAI